MNWSLDHSAERGSDGVGASLRGGGGSLAGRMVFGFGVVIVMIACVMVVVGLWGGATERAVAAHNAASDRAASALRIERLVFGLQRSTRGYLLLGVEGGVRRAREAQGRLASALSGMLATTEDSEQRERLVAIEERASRYQENFEHLAREQAGLDAAVLERLEPVFLEFAAWERAGEVGEPALVKAVSELERAVLSYLARVGGAGMSEIESALDAARASAAGGVDAAARGAWVDRAERAFREVRVRSLSLRQFTDVVLAGDAEELRQSARAWSERELERARESAGAVGASFESFRGLVLWLTFAALLVAFVAVWAVVRRTMNPLREIVGVFETIASGRHGVRVPGAGRDDEVGRLARVAEAYRQQSEEAEGLALETRRLTRDVERKGREIESFVYSASHDLKSPLVSLMGYIGYLKDDLDAGRYDRSSQFLGQIEDASQRIRRNIDDLLELSRAGAAPLQPERFRFAQVAQPALDDLRDAVEQRGIECVLEGHDVTLMGDRERLTDLVENLVSNAVKYGGDSESPVVRVSAERDGAWVVVRVSDNGPGIRPEDHDRIFGMFERLSATQEGTGLGLSIVRKIAEAHGGRVRLESTPGAGATFIVHLPIADPSGARS